MSNTNSNQPTPKLLPSYDAAISILGDMGIVYIDIKEGVSVDRFRSQFDYAGLRVVSVPRDAETASRFEIEFSAVYTPDDVVAHIKLVLNERGYKKLNITKD